MLQKPAGCGRLDMSRPRSKEINDAACTRSPGSLSKAARARIKKAVRKIPP